MTYEQLREGPRTLPEAVFEFVRSRFLSIIAVLLLGTLLAALIGLDLGLPRWAQLSLLTGLLLSPLAWMVSDWVLRLLPDPPGVVLVDVDARVMDGAVFWLPIDDFHELEVLVGELNQVGPELYFGKQVDLDSLTAEGTWRGTLSDRELLRGLQKVEECRGQLEDDARKGFVLETQAFTILRSAVRSTVSTVIETFESGTLPDEGEGLSNSVDQALDQFDLEERLDDELSDLDDLDADDQLLDPDDDRADDDLPADVDQDSRADPADPATPEVTADDD